MLLIKIKTKELETLVTNALKKYGYTTKESTIIKDILLYAQYRGNNQGIVKLVGNGIPRNQAGKTPTIVKQSKVSALVDGNCTHAMIVMNYITELAIKKAKKSGIAIIDNFNTSESTGAIGYYVKKVAN